jgi:hypothetical protein
MNQLLQIEGNREELNGHDNKNSQWNPTHLMLLMHMHLMIERWQQMYQLEYRLLVLIPLFQGMISDIVKSKIFFGNSTCTHCARRWKH